MKHFHLLAAALLCPAAAYAGANDFYRCIGAEEQIAYSVYPCAKGEIQTVFRDSSARSSPTVRQDDTKPQAGPSLPAKPRSQAVWVSLADGDAAAAKKPQQQAPKSESDPLKLKDLCTAANSGEGIPVQYHALAKITCPALYK